MYRRFSVAARNECSEAGDATEMVVALEVLEVGPGDDTLV
jgi:hypothetical protein